MLDIYSIVQTTKTTKTATKEIGFTAPMDGLVLSPGPGCVTPAPKNITGSLNISRGLNVNYKLYTARFNTKLGLYKTMW